MFLFKDILFNVYCWYTYIKVTAKRMKKKESVVTQSCSTLCDPVDCSPPGSSVHGILQIRIVEWVAMLFSRGYSWPSDWTQVSCITGRSLPSEPRDSQSHYYSGLKEAYLMHFLWKVQHNLLACRNSKQHLSTTLGSHFKQRNNPKHKNELCGTKQTAKKDSYL